MPPNPIRRGEPGGDNLIVLKLDGSNGETVIEQLRNALSASFTRVIDLFKDWDDDENGMVNKSEFRKALPMLGLKVDRSVAEELFDSFDADGSGEIDYKELHHHLRGGAGVELDAALQDGAAGEIVLDSKNAIATRGALTSKQRLEASALQGVQLVAGEAGSVAEQLLKALDKNLMRVIDLFREWDDDDSGSVSKKEFRRALPCLGLRVDKAEADSLFDSFDGDRSGSIEYNELHRAVKRRCLQGGSPLKSSRTAHRSSPRPPPSVSSASNSPLKGDWKQAVQDEAAARKRLLRVQREYERACHEAAKMAYHEERRAEVAATRADLARRIGTDVTDRLVDVQGASQEEVRALSLQVNIRMLGVMLPHEREWYLLFKAVDTDKSGRISFEEFESMIRGQLKMSREKLADARLQALWKSLDTDASGWLSAGEWGRFMKLGEQQAADHVAQRVAAAKAAKAAKAQSDKAEMDKLVGRDVTARLRDVMPATREETAALSKVFNEQMALAQIDTWYVVFKTVDTDKSGRISMKEFTEMVRGTLKLGPSELTREKLQALWKALDEDSSGWLSAGEWGRFMKLGVPPQGTPRRERVLNERIANFRRQRAEMAERVGTDLTDKLVGVEAAGKGEVKELSSTVNAKLAELYPGDPGAWYKLFKLVDLDGSGRVSWSEFETMVRSELLLSHSDVPTPKLQALWKALDEDSSGFISAGEFGRMIRAGLERAYDPSDPDAPRRRIQEKRVRARAGRIGMAQAEEAEQLRMKTRQAEEQKRAIEAEVARLEAALVEQRGRPRRVDFHSPRQIQVSVSPRKGGHHSTKRAGGMGGRKQPTGTMWVDPTPPP
jgi:Ca2+-binding EF-hand superfamily protein